MNRTLTSGGIALAMIGIFSCTEHSLTGVNNFSSEDLSADASRIATVSVSLGSGSIAVGDTIRAIVTLKDYRGQIVNRNVSWSSSNPAIASVDSAGLVKGVAVGTTVITASRGFKSGSATITVTPAIATGAPAVASVAVSLAVSSLNPGQFTQAIATAYDSSNNVLTGRAVAWRSSDTTIATISSAGIVTAVAPGTAQVMATSEAKTGSATLSVTALPTQSANPGAVADLSVTATDSTGTTLAFTQVADGAGQPAKYDIRYAVSPISWGSATSVTSGTCATPVVGTAIGSALTCKVLGLKPSTNYGFQLVAFRGTLNGGATFGSLSNVVTATTSASITPPPPPPPPPPTGSPEPGSGDVVLWQDNFNKLNLTDLLAPYATRGASQLITDGHSGTAVRFSYTSGSWDNLIEKSFPVTTDVYFRYWYRLSPGADPTCGGQGQSGFKWFMPWRVTTNLRYTMGVGNLPGGPSGFQNTGLEFSSHDNTSTTEPNPFMQNISKAKTFKTTADGAWHEYTLHVVTGNGGYEQIWVDGLLVLDNSAYHYDHDPNGIGLVQFPGTLVQWFSGCDFTVDVDDFVIWHK